MLKECVSSLLLRWCLLVLFMVVAVSGPVTASESEGTKVEKWNVGVTITSFSLDDQHGKKHVVGQQVKKLVVAHDMGGSKMATAAFESVAQAKFDERGIVYLADISGMPGLIAKMVAIPKMRKYPYVVLLDRNDFVKVRVPLKDKQLALFTLNNLKIENLQYFANPEELRKTLFGSP